MLQCVVGESVSCMSGRLDYWACGRTGALVQRWARVRRRCLNLIDHSRCELPTNLPTPAPSTTTNTNDNTDGTPPPTPPRRQ